MLVANDERAAASRLLGGCLGTDFVSQTQQSEHMPLYDYQCQQCSSVSELLITSSTVAACPKCGSEAVERLLSAPVAPGRSKELVANWRKRAAAEGHFSNFERHERPK